MAKTNLFRNADNAEASPVDERQFTFPAPQTPQFALVVVQTMAERLRARTSAGGERRVMSRSPFRGLCLALIALGGLTAAPVRAQTLYGAGSSLAAPLYQKWFQEYEAETGVKVSYEAIGSSGGIKNVTAHAVDFGASDMPLTDAEALAARGIVHVPTVAHAVVLTYNLPHIGAGLRLTGPIIADIYLGKVSRWDDPRIVQINPGLALPDLAILPGHQSSGGGTTGLLTTYLSRVSPAWESGMGAGKSVHWPVGLGGAGDGVTRMVRQNEGGIGYVEMNYALANALPCAAIQNDRGNFILPTLESAAAAAEAAGLPPDLRGSAVNSPAPRGYPIVGYTYLLAYKNGTKPDVRRLFKWALTDGQRDAAGMGFAPLPLGLRKKALVVTACL